MNIEFGDLFAGGGGTSSGALSVPGVHVAWALNHDPIAIATHAANHPETKHFQADIRTQNVAELSKVNLLWASLECTNHSRAKGGADKDEGSFTLGWELPRYVIHSNADMIIIENVPEFTRWGDLSNGKRVKGTEGREFRRWVDYIKSLGYENYSHRFLNAADYGAPTRRIRYIGVFSRSWINFQWPEPTHSKTPNLFGLKPWTACRQYIDLTNEGESIFGRTVNPNVKRKVPLSPKTLRRIAGGMKKFASEQFFIMKYYGNSTEGNSYNCQTINRPLDTITTKERHVLIKAEKFQFIADHCHLDNFQTLDDPLRPQLCRQTKQLITVESGRKQFISAYFNSNGSPESQNQSLDNPLNSITTANKFALVTVEKKQFISTYFSSNGIPEVNNHDLQQPLPSICTKPKHTLVTVQGDELDFDIKMRFLNDEELASIMGFRKGYFKRNGLTGKQAIKMIGNAVPVQLARVVVEAAVKSYKQAHTALVPSNQVSTFV